jgi:hypothetical protein
MPKRNWRNARRSGNPMGIPLNTDWDKQPLGKMFDVDIALKLGVTESAVTQARNRRGIPRYRGKYTRIAPYKEPIMSKGKFDSLYGKFSLEEIAKQYGISRSTISRLKKRYGISRSRTEIFGRHIKNPFEELNLATAWALGWIITDGSINLHKGRPSRFTIGSVDIQVLERLCEVLDGLNPRIRGPSPAQKSPVHYLVVNSRLICDYLGENYGIVPNKWNNVPFPEIDEKLLPHLMRGLWEGDGHFVKKYSSFMAGFTTGSPNLMQSVVDTINQNFGTNLKIYKRENENCYRINLNTKCSVLFAHWIYENAGLNKLDRKYSIVEPFIGGA